MIPVKRTDIRLKADPRRVVLLKLGFPEHKIIPIIDYVQSMEEDEVGKALKEIYFEFQDRHLDFERILLEHYSKVESFVSDSSISPGKKRLLGAYFTHEYTIEAAALFNPSIVPHPDQSGLEKGALRFIMSLRAVGEGHISSIEFKTGTISQGGAIQLDPSESKLSCGKLLDVQFDRTFVLERGCCDKFVDTLAREYFPDRFSKQEGLKVLKHLEEELLLDLSEAQKQFLEVFEMNYDLEFDEDIPLDGRVLFPKSSSESNGMEDARFVYFNDGDESFYLATYTAYNGRAIQPQLITTTDFKHFKIRPFYGKAASDKGMAFFPEKINGKYAMISRQGGRNISIMYSDDLYFWDDFEEIQWPKRGWEMCQMGNSGNPVKTAHGWLLLTHAVGPMRKYVLSLSLLDLHHPEKVLASLDQALMSPNKEEREGYVPNVLYTCGLIPHGENLIIPYAMSDSATSFAVVNTESLLTELLNSKKEKK